MSSNNLLLLLLLLFLQLQQQQAASHSTIEYLPGLQGRLPFPLETGLTKDTQKKGLSLNRNMQSSFSHLSIQALHQSEIYWYVGIGKDEEVQLFYYFLESESEPTTDPLLVWLSGGPGCSSVIAIVNEIVNTGFSYATNSAAYKYTDVQACEYVDEFLRKWLSDHPQYISNQFYISGNSYAGTIIPVIAQFILNGNAAGKEPLVNLEGYLLGNPITIRLEDYNYHIPFCHGMGLVSDELYKIVSNINVEHVLKPFCKNDDDLRSPYQMSGERRLLDDKLISLQHEDKCASDWRKHMRYWANDLEVQEALHVRKVRGLQ
ncbi:hypothetical protein MTR67_020835 [Solanum verrucosum]|uniref:Uncharacterized protein n=1 Tax=Solanum verrucosum TaxID=315347 RepID=A0AAF0QUQ5_SOLVR|nr:hypothetical protein MTR67_020835 [Solanum verrucosum]